LGQIWSGFLVKLYWLSIKAEVSSFKKTPNRTRNALEFKTPKKLIKIAMKMISGVRPTWKAHHDFLLMGIY
jgi:hypothetical protein